LKDKLRRGQMLKLASDDVGVGKEKRKVKYKRKTFCAERRIFE
jgi:hypothetical protein